MCMTKQEAINILSKYKGLKMQSSMMSDKVKEMETTIYSAQAGFVENTTGTRVSGGKHASRTQKIAELTDLKERYVNFYTINEIICSNTLKLIHQIYTENKKIEKVSIDYNEVSIKLQNYENVLIDYYINDNTICKIADKYGYSIRQMIRIINSAKEEFYQKYKNNDYQDVDKFLHGNIKLSDLKQLAY